MGENPNHPPRIKYREDDVTQMVINMPANQSGVILLSFRVPVCHHIDRSVLTCLRTTQRSCEVATGQSTPKYCLELWS